MIAELQNYFKAQEIIRRVNSMLTMKAYILGGAPSSLYSKTPIEDFDIFVIYNQVEIISGDIIDTISKLGNFSYNTITPDDYMPNLFSEGGGIYQLDAYNIDLILIPAGLFKKDFDTITQEDVYDTFDMDVCCMCFDADGEVLVSTRAEKDIKDKCITLKKRQYTGIKGTSLERINKYATRFGIQRIRTENDL